MDDSYHLPQPHDGRDVIAMTPIRSVKPENFAHVSGLIQGTPSILSTSHT